MKLLGRIYKLLRRAVLNVRIRIDRRSMAVRRPNTVWLPLRGRLPEHEVLRSGVLGLLPQRRTLLGLLNALDTLAQQQEIKRVVLAIGGLGGGLARAWNVAQAVGRMREAGIEVIALLERGGGLREYLIALQANRIVVPPGQTLNLVGLRAEYVLARELLDKLGVEPEIIAVGRFKSAGEMLERRELSPEARRQAEELIEDAFAAVAATLSERRGLEIEQARELLGRGPYRSQQAVELKLIDEMLYPDELRSRIKSQDSRLIQPARLLAVLQRPRELKALRSDQRLAIYYASGQIVTGSPGPLSDPVIAPRQAIAQLNRLRRDHAVKGVLLRISSPGGSAAASDAIWRAVVRLAEKKPLVASFGDVAASGGYYIAMPSRRIFAEPTTLTGSIGVVGGKLNLAGLYHKLGLNKEAVSRGAHADLFSDSVGLRPETRAKLVELMEATYAEFVDKAAAGRKMERDKLDSLAQGRVYAGARACELGLVDELGGLDDALRNLKELAGIEKDQPVFVEELPRPRGALELLRAERDADARLLAGLPERARTALSRLWCLSDDPLAALCLLDPPEG